MTAAPAKAGRREWAGLAVLCLPTMLTAVDLNVMFLALPQMSADLGANGVQQLWIADVYGFLITSLLVTMGALGDRIGRRKVLLSGAAVFLVASVAAAFATPGCWIWRGMRSPAGSTRPRSSPPWPTPVSPFWRSRAFATSHPPGRRYPPGNTLVTYGKV
ncbi:MFS transporter [Acrocarpospora sp. B8E8]|uniref:MFS transporter n=1 Tax=Acrocarpospora sp. B8E8 TaxID=3153572 RepID=UPI00325EA6EC